MGDIRFPDVTQLAIPFFVAAMLLELAVIRYFRRRGDYETRDTLTSLLMGTGNVVSGILLGFIAFGVLMWAWQFRLFDLGTSWPVIVLCFILDDLRYYWYHRIAHRSRWVWAEHVTHHSSQHYNLSTALRQSWTGTLTGMFILRIPLALLGFHPLLLAFVGGLNLVYQFWIHTEAIGRMWKPIELIFNTPSHHRVHHATNPRYLDANFAGTLIVWDRMFGTFVPELDEDLPRYGIVRNIGTFNPIRVAFHEWIDMFKDAFQPGLSLRQRIGYLFAPPGWSHDGSRLNSAELKAEYVGLHPETAGTPGLPASGSAVAASARGLTAAE
ncbi:sterol desaturase/sphingolipid hydroxylase (fatty acid hydroxylase superfamily) [Hoeflea marina]|uniref:Sterol desaturase/sphingolipid hydroxylase (Fatty acid hydroxylase superfamily) n=1 Tax=Hoeflea marina TaxID=274592 RepID=A0A317PTZ9_9HYPH|nr:sterol desaturase family protein [Hoeflea marina]PWW04185.1 sterol desaturase/sphingolipid hydroxylase (fatty acid hydroxylase superfamily) [Hoeflea marina]